MKKNKTRIVGKTPYGKLVLAGVFQLRGTYGASFDELFYMMEQRQCIPAWDYFYADARRDGWKHETIVSQLNEALLDVYGHDFRDHVIAYIETLKESPNANPTT